MLCESEGAEIAGTPPCMSPEILNLRKYSPPVDVWAFGCVLAHMGSGQISYQQIALTDRNAMLAVIKSGEVSPLKVPHAAGLEGPRPAAYRHGSNCGACRPLCRWAAAALQLLVLCAAVCCDATGGSIACQTWQLLFEVPNTPKGIVDIAKDCCSPGRKDRPTFQTISESLSQLKSDDDDVRPRVRAKNKKVSLITMSADAEPSADAGGGNAPPAFVHSTYFQKFQKRSSDQRTRGTGARAADVLLQCCCRVACCYIADINPNPNRCMSAAPPRRCLLARQTSPTTTTCPRRACGTRRRSSPGATPC